MFKLVARILKLFAALSSRLNVLYNYFDDPAKLLYFRICISKAKFLYSAKPFSPCRFTLVLLQEK